MIPRILTSLFAAFILLPDLATAGEPPVIKPAKPQDGVFALGGIFSSTILELKEGRFRYWFSTDFMPDSLPEYPLAGEYVFERDTVVLKEPRIHSRVWTFRMLDGQLTLWRPSAIDFYNRKQQLSPWGILYLTDKPAEELWRPRKQKPK